MALATTPEEAVRAYVAQVKAGGLGSAAGHFHPEELAQFRTMMVPVIDEVLKEPDGPSVFGRFAEESDTSKQRELGPEAFMAAFLQSIEALQPAISQALKTFDVEIIGHVKEGEVSHVVGRFKAKIQGVDFEEMTVMSTRDYQGTAKMVLSGDIRRMAEVFRSP